MLNIKHIPKVFSKTDVLVSNNDVSVNKPDETVSIVTCHLVVLTNQSMTPNKRNIKPDTNEASNEDIVNLSEKEVCNLKNHGLKCVVCFN